MFFTDSYMALRRGRRLVALRYAVLSVLILTFIGLSFGFFMLRRFEKSVTFHPERAPWGGVWRVPEGGEDVWFKVASGERLHGWFVRARSQPAAATVIYFHGNGGNLSYLDWVGESLSARGFDVLLFDYRGYGQSEGEVSDERVLYEDADAAYNYVVKERGVPPERLVLYGQSLGTAAVADLAARERCGAIILESGLSSASDMAATILPWIPRWLHRFSRNKLDSVGKLPKVRCPVLVVHGEDDEIIPLAQGRALYRAAPEPKRLLIVPRAGHNNLPSVGGENYQDTLDAFIRTSLKP
jgi:hypothetical protein